MVGPLVSGPCNKGETFSRRNHNMPVKKKAKKKAKKH
jgi:hypothetical protein